MMHVKGPHDIGLIGHAGSGDVRIVNRRKMNDRLGAIHCFHDLAEILNVADKVLDGAPFLPGHAVEHGDFVGWVVEQFAHDPLTHFADPAGDKNLHYADAPITSSNSTEAQRSLRKGFMKITLRALYHYNANFALIWNARTQR